VPYDQGGGRDVPGGERPVISPGRSGTSGANSHEALAKLGIAIIAVILFTAMFAPLLAPHDPTDQNLDNTNIPPLGFMATENQTSTQMVDGEVQIVEEEVVVNTTAAHPLGTDSLGRDVLSRTMFGARTSLLVGLFGTSIAVVLGVTVGITAGYYGGRIDDALMRFADVMLAFPSLVLAIALIGLWGQARCASPTRWSNSGSRPQRCRRISCCRGPLSSSSRS